MDDLKLRAKQAAAILENPVYNLALSELETDLINSWKDSSPVAQDDREQLYAYMQFLKTFKNLLALYIKRASDQEAVERHTAALNNNIV